MSPCEYALASSLSNTYIGTFVVAFGGVPIAICTGSAAFAGAAALDDDDDAAAAFAFAGGGAAATFAGGGAAAFAGGGAAAFGFAGGGGADCFAFLSGGDLGLSLSDELTSIGRAFFFLFWASGCIYVREIYVWSWRGWGYDLAVKSRDRGRN